VCGTAAESGCRQYTGPMPPLLATDPGRPIVGLIDQTDLHFTIASALGPRTAAKAGR
jgi:hypothetical protein